MRTRLKIEQTVATWRWKTNVHIDHRADTEVRRIFEVPGCLFWSKLYYIAAGSVKIWENIPPMLFAYSLVVYGTKTAKFKN